MDNLLDIIIDKFGLSIESAVKDRSCYIIETDSGNFVAKKSAASKDHIIFQHKVKEFLFAKSFCNTDRFLLSCNDLPYINRGDDLITVSRFYRLREADFTFKPDAEKVSEMLGYLHSLTENYNFSQVDTVFMPDMISEYKKGIVFLQGIKKILKAGKGLSDFDVTVAKSYDHYYKRAEAAVKLFHELETIGLLNKRLVICHNLVKESNFLIDEEGETFITEFSKISAAHPVFDISRLLQRILKSASRNSHVDIISVKSLLNSYMKFGELDDHDIKMLYAVLIYPHNFIKACMSFYNKKRTFVPVSVKNKLDLIIGNKDIEEQYIGQILSL